MAYLLLKGLALIKQLANILGNRAQLLTKLAFINPWKLVQQALILLKLSLSLCNLRFQDFQPDGLLIS
ncbi:hypothetical protein KBY75_08415 [Cyanobium sp. T1G-Tous]|uniref:hypothetical protein n=1 Tax=Cyanobium sp. T1G-Tous TaxID=2823722 RepID=UPI0020CC5487|nr:hypothetical protein [Cyanobium sp. T1G-Tous]MCP9803590.1 hypothetical protein [Cyanobium sp. T1G-Tous]